jgi:hypothetical protein
LDKHEETRRHIEATGDGRELWKLGVVGLLWLVQSQAGTNEGHAVIEDIYLCSPYTLNPSVV